MLGKRPVQALNNLNLQVNQGEFIAIMGPSGSGKTTLLNVIGCIDKPTDGQVLLDGIDVGKMPENQLYKIRRDKMGFIFQTFNLLPYLNARENVELPMEGKIKSKTERKKRASELLALVGLSGREGHRPQRLSAGEQQRVAIARALANNPAIILADEPTGNLDSQNKQEIIKLLANLNLTQGTTIIMVTHDSQAANHTERMLLLKDGKIIKEKEGLHLAKKNSKCPNCGSNIKPDDVTCPICKKPILATVEEPFSS
jgi:putative ABC transport system ATP-binding protein